MLLLIVLVAPALAAEKPVLVLPADEPPAAWSAAATLAGFTVGQATEGARVELIHGPSGWSLIARNGAADEIHVAIAAPSTPQAREDAAWLASSLLTELPHAPAAAPPTARMPTAPPAATPTAPSPTRIPLDVRRLTPTAGNTTLTEVAPPPLETIAPPPPPAAPPVAPDQLPVVTAATPATACPEVVALVPPPTPGDTALPAPAYFRPRFWATAGPTVAWRADTSLGAGADLTLGLRAGDAVWLGLSARWLASRTFPDIPSSVVAPSVDVSAGMWWSPSGWLAPLVGVGAGVSSRSYAQGTREIDRFLVPFGAADAGARVRLGERLDVVLGARLIADASVTLATLGESDPVPLSPWELGGRLTLWGTLPGSAGP